MKKESLAASGSWPRLLAEQSDAGVKSEVGFLQITGADKRLKIGDTASREFKLLQCLFSAQNFLSAKYAPVTQTYERLYGAIKISSDSLNESLSNVKSAPTEMRGIVHSTMRALKGGAAGKYIQFVDVGDKLRIEIVGAAA